MASTFRSLHGLPLGLVYLGIGAGLSALLGSTITESQLLIVCISTFAGIAALILKALLAAPERESDAYKRGVADASARCDKAITKLEGECASLRAALLHLTVASDLTPAQRKEIATALGYKDLPPGA